jgi:hypothetical protein
MPALRLGLKKGLLHTEGREAIEYTWCRKQERYEVMKIIKAISFPRHITRDFYTVILLV